METEVLIVGAGPSGLCLALELAQHGVRSIVAEARGDGELTTVRCNHVSARSMEFFRRIGIAERVRDSGLPANYDQDVSYRITTTGRELTRIRIPSRADRGTERDDGPDSWWPTAEPPHRINQIYLEPILVDAARSRPEITLLYDTRITSFEQTADGVAAEGVTRGGRAVAFGSRFLVGADGGSSAVRKAIGARLHGDAVIQRVQSTYVRAPGLIEAMSVAPCWCMFSLNPRRSGNIYSIDGKERWLIHNYLRDSEADFESVDRDESIRSILGVGPEFEYEIIHTEDWFGRRLVTDKMREGRVFLCGDAAHLWVPYAGYGMNAGIADALDLGWLLAGVVNGWGGPRMLDAYEAERLPITEQVSRFAMDHCIRMAAQRGSVPDDIEDDTPEGETARKALGRQVYDLNVQQYCAGGLNFGYFYDASPVIAYDGESAPGYSMAQFTPSTVPGCRVPHFWIEDGVSLFDRLGTGYTLLRTDRGVDWTPFEKAARDAGVPLKLLDVTPPESVRQDYVTPLVLVRPDQHVAWRGHAGNVDAAAVIDKVRGAASGARDQADRSSSSSEAA